MNTRTLTHARMRHLPHREGAGGTGGHMPERAEHISVMLDEAVEFLAPQKGDLVVDATYGQGGHSAALRGLAHIKLIGFDADPASKKDGVLTANFADMESVLADAGVKEVNKVLFDLGWNRGQLSSNRGFSFLTDEPLNMSFSPEPRSGFTAAQMLNAFSEKALADMFYGYGEERYAKRIAKAIVERRAERPLETTMELVEIIRDNVPASYRHLKLHFATRTFQALRIAVNDELRVLEQGLRAAWKLLACDGRIVVITFHSLEDRIVKNLFREFANDGGEILTKKPLTPTKTEIIHNPASRSAKMRALQKICTQ